ncbi:MAG: hypothetical protein VX549_13625 [Pseudomonadota bacterium]|nr:hypothetical protein [Pseudomonadota bacterium]
MIDQRMSQAARQRLQEQASMNAHIDLDQPSERRHLVVDEYRQVAESMIFAVYRDLNVSATGRLLGRTLMDEIGKRGKVRDEDVADAIRHLIEQDCLVAREDEDDWLIELTPKGFSAIHTAKWPLLDLGNPWGALVERYQTLQARLRATARLKN